MKIVIKDIEGGIRATVLGKETIPGVRMVLDCLEGSMSDVIEILAARYDGADKAEVVYE